MAHALQREIDGWKDLAYSQSSEVTWQHYMTDETVSSDAVVGSLKTYFPWLADLAVVTVAGLLLGDLDAVGVGKRKSGIV